jgi:hypothetical protein
MRRYLRDFAAVSRQLGALLGAFLIVLSIPGILTLLGPGDVIALHVSGAWRIGIAMLSGLFCAIGVYLVFAALRLSLYFSFRDYFGFRDRVRLQGRSKHPTPNE